MFDATEELLFSLEAIKAVQQFFGPDWLFLFELVTLLGDTWGILFVVGLGLWVWGRETAYALFGIVALGSVVKQLMTVSFSVPRPAGEGIRIYKEIPMASFPSGHVFAVVGPWGLLYALGRLPFLIPALLVVLVGLTRIYLGMHYLGDIIFSVIFGALFIWAYLYLWREVRDWLAARTLGFYSIIGLVALALCLGNIVVTGSTPRLWEVVGVMGGVVGGFLLEYRYVGYAPRPVSWPWQALKVVIGLGGIVVVLIIDRMGGEGALLLGAATTALGALWALLGAPALFTWMGLSEEAEVRRVAKTGPLSAAE